MGGPFGLHLPAADWDNRGYSFWMVNEEKLGDRFDPISTPQDLCHYFQRSPISRRWKSRGLWRCEYQPVSYLQIRYCAVPRRDAARITLIFLFDRHHSRPYIVHGFGCFVDFLAIIVDFHFHIIDVGLESDDCFLYFHVANAYPAQKAHRERAADRDQKRHNAVDWLGFP